MKFWATVKPQKDVIKTNWNKNVNVNATSITWEMHKLEENIKQAVYPSDMIVHTIFSTKAITVML